MLTTVSLVDVMRNFNKYKWIQYMKVTEPKASAGERTVNFGSEPLGLAEVERIPREPANVRSI
jgi:hypothetical protein